jgi:hypothetical protein
MENTYCYNGCTIEFKSDFYDFYEEYQLGQKIPIAKILNVDFVHFDEPTIKMFASVLFSEMDGTVTTKYILDYTHNGQPPQTIEFDGLSHDSVNNGIFCKIKAFFWRDVFMESLLRVRDDVIDVATKHANELTLNDVAN